MEKRRARDRAIHIRGVQFAFAFAPVRFVTRDQASAIHAAICDGLRLDDITFAYRRSDDRTAFQVNMARREGQRAYQITLENPGRGQPVRLLLSDSWPADLNTAAEQFDATSVAVFSALQGECIKLLAEANVRAHVDVSSRTGLEFLRSRLLRDTDWLDAERDALSSCSVTYRLDGRRDEHGAGGRDVPQRVLQVEPLLKDPGKIYLELVSRWTGFSPPASTRRASSIRQENVDVSGKPGEYTRESVEFLTRCLLGLGKSTRSDGTGKPGAGRAPSESSSGNTSARSTRQEASS